MGPRLKVSSERPEKRGIDLVIPGLVVWRDIYYTTTAPNCIQTQKHEIYFGLNSCTCLGSTLFSIPSASVGRIGNCPFSEHFGNTGVPCLRFLW